MKLKFTIAIALIIIFTLLSCSIGVATVSHGSAIDWQVIIHSRLPRSLAILLTGASLSIAGLILQVLFTNRFVEPSMVGTTQGAALGLLLMSVYLPHTNLRPLHKTIIVLSLSCMKCFFK